MGMWLGHVGSETYAAVPSGRNRAQNSAAILQAPVPLRVCVAAMRPSAKGTQSSPYAKASALARNSGTPVMPAYLTIEETGGRGGRRGYKAPAVPNNRREHWRSSGCTSTTETPVYLKIGGQVVLERGSSTRLIFTPLLCCADRRQHPRRSGAVTIGADDQVHLLVRRVVPEGLGDAQDLVRSALRHLPGQRHGPQGQRQRLRPDVGTAVWEQPCTDGGLRPPVPARLSVRPCVFQAEPHRSFPGLEQVIARERGPQEAASVRQLVDCGSNVPYLGEVGESLRRSRAGEQQAEHCAARPTLQ
eukprot:scaffold5742_cov95-Isochrysis_galbana.AAC.2